MKDKNKEDIQKAYLYLVKAPGSNDVSVCAGTGVFYNGTKVIFPTRYGLDLGIVMGDASNLVLDKSDASGYVAGRKCICGACHFSHPDQEFADSDLKAMGEAPKFEFRSSSYEMQTAKTEEPETEKCWDSAQKEPCLVEVDGDVDWISHVATEEELERYQNNVEREKEAVTICKEKIRKHHLDMKLVTAHFLLCEPKVLFFFTSDDRVDFRELVKDLVSVFKMRIELRQIGVRDEARVLGGLAVCGRDFCCHCVSDKLNPVTIKMAKEQNLSLNSTKISGPCGRLLCCLSYEYDFYMEEKASYPTEGTKLKIGGEFYRVQDVNILTRKITVTGEEGGEFSIPASELSYSAQNEHWEVSREFVHEFLSD